MTCAEHSTPDTYAPRPVNCIACPQSIKKLHVFRMTIYMHLVMHVETWWRVRGQDNILSNLYYSSNLSRQIDLGT